MNWPIPGYYDRMDAWIMLARTLADGRPAEVEQELIKIRQERENERI